jgi:hypothetical protein
LVTIFRGIVIQKYPLAAATSFTGASAFGSMGYEMVVHRTRAKRWLAVARRTGRARDALR